MCKGDIMNEQSLFFVRIEYIFTQIETNLIILDRKMIN